MHKLNSYVIAVSFAIILCVAFEILTPNKKYRYIVRIVSGLFILNTLLEPLGNIMNFNLDSIDIANENYGEIMENYSYYEEKAKNKFDSAVYSAAAESMEKEIKSYAASVLQCKAAVSVAASQDNVSIRLGAMPEDKKSEITAYIKNNFGIIPEFTE